MSPSQAESKDEAEKPSESAEKPAEGEKVKSETVEPSEKEGESDGAEDKTAAVAAVSGTLGMPGNGSQVAERLGNLAINQKVAGSNPGCEK